MIYVAAWQLRNGEGRYCSRDCKYEALRRRPSPKADPIGTRRVRSDGYVVIKVAEGENNWPLEHRVVAEQMLGRPLTTDEHVHHINEDRADNRPENLRILTNAEHQKVHQHWLVQTKQVALTCEACGKAFTKKPSRVTKHNFCSNKCRMESGVAVDAMIAARFPET